MNFKFFSNIKTNIDSSLEEEKISKRSSLIELTQKINDLIEKLDEFNSKGINFLPIAKLNYLNNTILACLTDYAGEDKDKLQNSLSWLLKQSSNMLLTGIQEVGNNFVELKEMMANIERYSFKLHIDIKSQNTENNLPQFGIYR